MLAAALRSATARRRHCRTSSDLVTSRSFARESISASRRTGIYMLTNTISHRCSRPAMWFLPHLMGLRLLIQSGPPGHATAAPVRGGLCPPDWSRCRSLAGLRRLTQAKSSISRCGGRTSAGVPHAGVFQPEVPRLSRCHLHTLYARRATFGHSTSTFFARTTGCTSSTHLEFHQSFPSLSGLFRVIPRSSDTFSWRSMTTSAWARRCCSRTFSRRSRRFCSAIWTLAGFATPLAACS